jgi:hypothetical protein
MAVIAESAPFRLSQFALASATNAPNTISRTLMTLPAKWVFNRRCLLMAIYCRAGSDLKGDSAKGALRALRAF